MYEFDFTKNKVSLFDWLKFSFTPSVGFQVLSKLIKHFGSLKEALNHNPNTLSNVIPVNLVNNILNNKSQEIEKSLLWLKQGKDRHIITFQDEIYPEYLRHVISPPLFLFAEGNLDLLNNSKITIVGTRNPTVHGIENAKYFSYNLAKNGYTIVSGLASGVDYYAHISALDFITSTIAVIGTGINIAYPKHNKNLQDNIANKGLLLSEFKLDTPPLATNFPKRNQIVVGLSQVCLVVESSIDGSSMISANLAVEMGRDVMAIPGSIHNPMAKGCHKLIKNGAKLVESLQDIMEDLPNNLKDNLPNIYEDDIILKYVGYEEIHIDRICEISGLNITDIFSNLLEYELNGIIINCGNGYYKKNIKI
jgi:DNA processing protein